MRASTALAWVLVVAAFAVPVLVVRRAFAMEGEGSYTAFMGYALAIPLGILLLALAAVVEWVGTPGKEDEAKPPTP